MNPRGKPEPTIKHIKNNYMKKTLLSLVAATAIILTSCGGGGGYEADARKAGEMACEMQKLTTKAMAGDEDAKKKLEEKGKEMEEFGKKMEEKYKDKKGDKAFEEKGEKIVEEILAKCK
jgi:hypothetical protein